MPRRIKAEKLLQPAVHGSIATIFEPLKIPAHVSRAPRWVAREPCQVVPILVVGINREHGIMSGASAECTGARIQHSIDRLALKLPIVFGIAFLWLEVAVVPNEEVPLQPRVLRRKCVK